MTFNSDNDLGKECLKTNSPFLKKKFEKSPWEDESSCQNQGKPIEKTSGQGQI